MKKLIIKIGDKTHELPYNNEVFSFEVSEKYVPMIGDCVKVECKNQNKTYCYWFKIKDFTKTMVDFSLVVEDNLTVSKNGFFNRDNSRVYTQITPEELKAKYAEAGYEWDYETDSIKHLKWMPKDGDEVWALNSFFEPVKITFDMFNTFKQLTAEKDLLFPTEEKCKEFAEHCLSFHKK